MESPSSSQLGLVVGLPLIAITLAVIFAYLMTGGEAQESEPAAAPSPYAASPETRPIPASPTKPAPAAAPAAREGQAPPAAAQPAAARPAPDASTTAETFQDPKIREHAQLISIESARAAMKQRNLDQLRRLRESLRDERLAGVIAPNDLEAMDVGIDCLARASGFRQHADDFLDDHPASPLAASVREVCQ
jgi:type IV secretory pathway VirB10-like protein